MAPARIGKYQLVEKISQGGMGELYRARAEGPGGFEREVALKVIRKDVAADLHFVRMFVAEAKIASLLSHANLVHLYDFGVEDGRYFLAMELIEGRDLGKILGRCREQRSGLAPRFALRIVEQVALGLDYAHRVNRNGESLQIVHRDVTPQNVLVSFDGVVRLTDFGIARMRHSERLTQAGVIKGKFGYLSPEQASLGSVDRRSDLFSLGIVWWEALTGARLFAGDNHADVLKQVLDKPIRPPSSLNAELPPAIDGMVMRALEREPRRRYSSGRALAAAIHGYAASGGEVATEVELAREVRRLFYDQVPAKMLDLRGESSVSRSLTPSETKGAITVEADLVPETTSISIDLATTTTARQVAPTQRLSRRSARWLAAIGLGSAVAVAAVAFGIWAPTLRRRATVMNFPPEPAVTPASARLDSEPRAESPTGAPVSTATAIPSSTPIPVPTAITARPTPRPRRYGHLSFVAVKPWAEVIVDRVSRGYSPIPDLRMVAGVHDVVLRNEEASIRRAFRISLADQEELVFRGDLRSLQPRSDQ